MQLYSLPAGLDVCDLESSLQGAYRVGIDADRGFQRTYLETFDRRVAAAGEVPCGEGFGEVVERDVGGPASNPVATVRWRAPGGREFTAVSDAERPIRFAEDLPPGPLRERLAEILGLRALLPMVVVQGQTQQLRVLDRERKTVARLVVYDLRALDGESRAAMPLGRLVEVRSLRGYEREARRVHRALRKGIGLELARPLLELAFEAIGRRSFGHSTRLDLPLDPETPAHRALRDVLLRLLETIRVMTPGVRAQLDTEFLHDLRVAVRRTRAALRLFRGVLPEAEVARFGAEFAWIGQVTGPVRDLDVHLLEFDEHAERIEAASRQHLEPLRDLLIEERAKQHVELAEALDSERWQRLLDDWEQWLRHDPSHDGLLAEGARPIGLVAVERTTALHRRLLRRGRKIDDGTPAERLHDLRKLGKKLRYSLELFRGLYDRKALRRTVRTMKVLQNNLGDFQDQEVQQEALTALGQQLLARKATRAETLLVMGRIVDDLARRQIETRKHFADCFAILDSKPSRRQFAELLGGVRQPEVAQ